jgi:N-methylhydantoinase A
VLVGCGGAGPLHAASVGRALGCRRVFLPRLSGAFCALGMLHSDVRHDRLRVLSGDLDRIPGPSVDEVFQELEADVEGRLAEEGFGPATVAVQRALDLRYVGQQWDITVQATAFDPRAIRKRFEAEHERLFGHIQPDGPIEITKARVAGFGRLPPLAQQRAEAAPAAPAPTSRREAWIDPVQGWAMTPVYGGRDLRPGHRLVGPLVVEEETTTLLAGAADALIVDATGNYAIELGGSALEP